MSKTTTIPRAELESLVNRSMPFVGDSGVGGQVFQKFTLFSKGRARSSNGVIGVEVPFTAIDGVALALDAYFGALLSTQADVKVVHGEGDHLEVTAAGFRARLATVPLEQLPTWPEPPPKESWSLLTPEAWAGVTAVEFAAEKGVGSEISGVAMRGGVAVATDRYLLARARTSRGLPRGFLPVKFLEALGKITVLGSPPVAVAFADRAWVRFADGTICWAGLPAQEFPDSVVSAVVELSKAVGRDLAVRWSSPTVLAEAVARVRLFGEDACTRVRGDTEGVVLRAAGQHGEAEETVPLAASAPFEFEVNGEKFEDGVKRSSGFAVGPGAQCVLFRAPNFELVLMCLVRA